MRLLDLEQIQNRHCIYNSTIQSWHWRIPGDSDNNSRKIESVRSRFLSNLSLPGLIGGRKYLICLFSFQTPNTSLLAECSMKRELNDPQCQWKRMKINTSVKRHNINNRRLVQSKHWPQCHYQCQWLPWWYLVYLRLSWFSVISHQREMLTWRSRIYVGFLRTRGPAPPLSTGE